MTSTPAPAAAYDAAPQAGEAARARLCAPRLARACAALALAALQLGCWPEAEAVVAQPTAAPPPREVDAVRVTEDQMHQLRLATVEPFLFRNQKPAIGQIAFNEDRSTVVVTPFSGRVIRVIGKIGDEIKRGDPLFEIDSPEVVQAQTDLIAALQLVQKAKSQLGLAKRVLDRQTSLLAGRATSQREVDQANADHAAAESDVTTAEGTLNAARNRLRVIIGRDQAEVDRLERERMVNPLITINAPLDGTIIARKVGPGQYVRADAGDQLYAIADLSVMWLKANVPEVDIPLVKVGQELEVRVTALPERVFRARITAIGAASDAATRRVVVRSEIPNPDGALRAEMFASFKIATGDGENALAVPTDAVIWDGEQATVWVERERDPKLFERRQVKLGPEQEGRLLVRSGLKGGERVVARGAIFVDNEWRQ
jgi:cobalt-zinc-cadmium efflux system membrane fusion protein